MEHRKRSHAEAVKRIGHYLLGTRDKGLVINPKTPWLFDCWVDADYAGNWHYNDAHIDPMTSKSRSGWVVRFAVLEGVVATRRTNGQTVCS